MTWALVFLLMSLYITAGKGCLRLGLQLADSVLGVGINLVWFVLRCCGVLMLILPHPSYKHRAFTFFINSENQLNSAHLSTTVKDKQSLCWRTVCTSRAQRHLLKTFPMSGSGSGFRIPCFPNALAPCHSLTHRHIRLTLSPKFNFGESFIKWVSLFFGRKRG